MLKHLAFMVRLFFYLKDIINLYMNLFKSLKLLSILVIVFIILNILIVLYIYITKYIFELPNLCCDQTFFTIYYSLINRTFLFLIIAFVVFPSSIITIIIALIFKIRANVTNAIFISIAAIILHIGWVFLLLFIVIQMGQPTAAAGIIIFPFGALALVGYIFIYPFIIYSILVSYEQYLSNKQNQQINKRLNEYLNSNKN